MCACVSLAHSVLWKWFSSILPRFLGCLGVLVPGVCVCVRARARVRACVRACSLLSVVLYTRIGVVLLSPCAWVHCICCGYSLEYVLCSVHCPVDFALCEFVHC